MNIEEHKIHHLQLGFSDVPSDYYLRDGSVPLTGDLDAAGYTISNSVIQNPTVNSGLFANAIFTDAGLQTPFIDDFSRAVHSHQSAAEGGTILHSSLVNLLLDDHTQYARLDGRGIGQTLTGGTSGGNSLTLSSTSDATKGKILFGTSAYDEVNNRLGVGTVTPEVRFHSIQSNDLAGVFEEVTSDTAVRGGVAQLRRTSTGNMADGFGVGLNFAIEDNAGVVNTLGAVDCIRAGADNIGDIVFRTNNAGSITNKFWIKADGKIGIGTSGGTYPVELLTTGSSPGFTQTNGTCTVQTYVSSNGPGWVGTVTNHALAFFVNNGGAVLVIDNDGQVGIGTGNSSAYKLEVVQDSASTYATRIFHDGNNNNRWGLAIQCGVYAPDAATTTTFIDFFDGDGTVTGAIVGSTTGVVSLVDVSDEARKMNIAPTQVVALDVISNLNLIEYNRFKVTTEDTRDTTYLYAKQLIGFSAQNCQDIFPTMTTTLTDGTLGVIPATLIPVLVKAIQEQQALITSMEARIAVLENSVKIP